MGVPVLQVRDTGAATRVSAEPISALLQRLDGEVQGELRAALTRLLQLPPDVIVDLAHLAVDGWDSREESYVLRITHRRGHGHHRSRVQLVGERRIGPRRV